LSLCWSHKQRYWYKVLIALVVDMSLYLHGTLAVTIYSLSYVTKNLGTANCSVQVAI